MSQNKLIIVRRLKILIHLDADHHVGLAHAVRVSRILSLGKARYGDLWDFDISLIGHLPQYDKFFDGSVCVYCLDQTTEQDKALAVVNLAKEIAADILLVDHPHLTKISWQTFAGAGLPIIAIDDEGGDVVADLIFNGTVLNEYHHYPYMPQKDHIKSGGQYALINPSFRENSWTDPKDLSLITVIGSGDRACAWALKLTAADGPLLKLEGFRKTMLVGAAFPHLETLRENCRKNDITLYQGLDQNAMAQLLCQHMMGLITGGMIVYEALSLGLPVMIFPQEKNLPPEADYFMKQGCAVDLGYGGGMDMGLVLGEIMTMAASHHMRLELSSHARYMIDGKGMFRTIEELNIVFEGILMHQQQRIMT